MIKFNHYFLILIFGLICPSPVLADHCPEERQAAGKPETTLAGITFERGNFPKVIKLYGQADTRQEYTDATFPEGSGEVKYYWKIESVQLDVRTWFYHRDNTRIESVIFVQIKGNSDIPSWETGRGLHLGDNFQKVLQLYGSVFLEGTVNGLQPPGNKVTVCFSNETRLGVEVNDDGKITAIWLAPSLE